VLLPRPSNRAIGDVKSSPKGECGLPPPPPSTAPLPKREREDWWDEDGREGEEEEEEEEGEGKEEEAAKEREDTEGSMPWIIARMCWTHTPAPTSSSLK
jgi:hypothetical protein